MKRQIMAAIGIGLLLGAGLVQAPAQAWGYCYGGNPPGNSGAFNLYRGQGYCPPRKFIYPVFGVCVNLAPYGANNWAGSVWNRTSRTVIVFERPNCDRVGGPYKPIARYTSDPDLYYPDYLYHNVSSIEFV